MLTIQSLNGVEGLKWTGHCEGAAQILKARGFYDRNDDFERKILVTIRAPVVSLFHSKSTT